MKDCGHPPEDLARRRRLDGRVDLVCKACHREYMRLRRERERREPARNWQRRVEVIVYPELARRPWE